MDSFTQHIWQVKMHLYYFVFHRFFHLEYVGKIKRILTKYETSFDFFLALLMSRYEVR